MKGVELIITHKTHLLIKSMRFNIIFLMTIHQLVIGRAPKAWEFLSQVTESAARVASIFLARPGARSFISARRRKTTCIIECGITARHLRSCTTESEHFQNTASVTLAPPSKQISSSAAKLGSEW